MYCTLLLKVPMRPRQSRSHVHIWYCSPTYMSGMISDSQNFDRFLRSQRDSRRLQEIFLSFCGRLMDTWGDSSDILDNFMPGSLKSAAYMQGFLESLCSCLQES